MADYGRFAPAQISFSGIENAVDSFEQGGAIGRQHQLRNLLGTPQAKDLLAKQDFGGLAALVSRIDPAYGMKLLNEGNVGGTKYGLNPVQIYNPNTRQMELWQPSSAGGPAHKIEFGQGVPTVQQRYLEGPGGYGGYPARGPYSPIGSSSQLAPGQPDFSAAQPPVPLASQMDTGQPPQEGVGPEPAMAPPTMPNEQPVFNTPQAPAAFNAPQQPQPGAIPSLGAKKYQDEYRDAKGTARAIAKDAIAGFSQMDKTLSNFINPDGTPTAQLKAITGTGEVAGVPMEAFGYSVPKSALVNATEEARNAQANLETGAIQVGLQTLAKMRAASAQGASGMGQLAIQESVWLQNSIDSLKATQGTPQAAQHIMDIRRFSKMVQDRVREKFREVYGEELGDVGLPSGQPQAAPAQGGQRKVYDINGNPL